MANDEFHFITHWRVEADIAEVYDILYDPPDLVRWWPSVYMDVKQIEEGDSEGIGAVFDLYTKGWLPYTLRWQFRFIAKEQPSRLEIEAWDDFVGRGIWTLVQEGEMAAITYDWKIRAEKPLLKHLSFLLRPFFQANHRWAMDQGEKSLNRELQRRHSTGKTASEVRATIV